MDFLLKEAERLCKKQKTFREAQLGKVDDLQRRVDEARTELEGIGGGGDNMEVDGADENEASMSATQEVLLKLKSDISAVATALGDGKSSQSAIIKFGKQVDKLMPPDLGKAVKAMPMDSSLVNKVIMDHLVRTGHLEVAKTLAEECGERLDENKVRPFVEMMEVISALRHRDIGPAKMWAHRNEAALAELDSDLGFRIVQMEFVQLVSKGQVVEAVEHARRSFQAHVPQWLGQVQKLMGCLAFVGRLERSPYAELFHEREWQILEVSVTREGCLLMGLPKDAALEVCVEAGIKALPSLLKFANVMQGRIGDWGSKNALPVEIDLGPDRRYHSVFVCPVSREQASADNPPMMMQCGHVLCEHSLKKMSRGASRFKCPYCPVEVSVHGSITLYI